MFGFSITIDDKVNTNFRNRQSSGSVGCCLLLVELPCLKGDVIISPDQLKDNRQAGYLPFALQETTHREGVQVPESEVFLCMMDQRQDCK